MSGECDFFAKVVVAHMRSLCSRFALNDPTPAQVSGERDFFAKVVVDAVTKLDPETLDLRMLGIKKVQVRGNQASKVGAGNVVR